MESLISSALNTKTKLPCAHSGQTLPQVCVDGVLVAVAFQISNDPLLKHIRAQELPQHVQDTCTLTKHTHTHTLHTQMLSDCVAKNTTLR